MATATYTRWTPQEYAAVIREGIKAHPRGPLAVLLHGQVIALASERHRTREELGRLASIKSHEWWADAYQRHGGMNQAQALAALEAAAPPSFSDYSAGRMAKAEDSPEPAAKPAKAHIYWTTLEKARLAGAVTLIQTRNPSVSLASAVKQAQLTELLPERRKSMASIYEGSSSGRLAEALAEGARNAWLLTANDDTAKALEGAVAPVSAPTPATPTPKPTEAPSAAAIFPAAMVAAPAPVAAPAVTSVAGIKIELPSLADALANFASDMQRGLQTVITATAQHTMAQLDAKLARVSSAIAEQLAARMREELAGIVTDTLMNALSVEVVAPAPMQLVTRPFADATAKLDAAPPPPEPARIISPPAAPATLAIAERAARIKDEGGGALVEAGKDYNTTPEKLRIDVIGFSTRESEEKVIKACAAWADLRFHNPDMRGAIYAPHKNRHVLVLQGTRLTRQLSDKLRAAKVKHVLIKASADHVIHACEEHARARGIHV